MGHTGRLGNHLFQLASTIGIADRLGEDAVFPPDWIYRPFFSVPDELFGRIPQDAKEACELTGDTCPESKPYMQDWRLFWDSWDKIRGYLKPSAKAEEILEPIEQQMHDAKLYNLNIGVHVRRGDIAHNPLNPLMHEFHLCMSDVYYWRAISRVTEEIRHCCDDEFYTDMSDYQPKRLIFSDDIPWCTEHVHGDWYGHGVAHPNPHEYGYTVQQPTDWMDLILMTRWCDALVISGSTFGVWAALLSELSGNRIVRPTEVYGTRLKHIDITGLFRPDWIAIESSVERS